MKLTSSAFHPFLFAIFPILFLFANNFFKVSAEDVIIPLVISVSFTIALWFTLKRITNSRKSGIITSLFLVLFFSYGHIFIAADGVDILGFNTATHYHFGMPFILIFSAITFLVLTTKRPLNNATKISNAISVTLIIITVFNIGTLGIEGIANPEYNESRIVSLDEVETGNLPDIYYMVFDSYGNYNTLKSQFGYDNDLLLEYLDSRNFIMPSATHSNYPETRLSLPSTLNMQYLDVESSPDNIREAKRDTHKIINNNEVMIKLKEKGYKIINFNSGIWVTDSIKIADRHLCDSNFLNSEFIGMVIRTSMLNRLHAFFFEHDFRHGVNCIFDTIPNLKDEYDKPIFVFAHVFIPHPPYVFGPNGEAVDVESLSFTDGWDIKKGYLDQVKYANKRIPDVVDAIMSDETPPPIIIIQSDHGPKYDVDYVNPSDEMVARVFGILNAYHLPDGCNDQIYDSITPVNSFRVIFNCYFDEDYELLDDSAYWTMSNGTIFKVNPKIT